MSEHLHVPKIDPSDQSLPNQPFFSWLRSQTALFLSQIFGLASFISFAASLIYYVQHAGHDQQFINLKNIQAFIYYAHIVIIVIFVIWLYVILDVNNRNADRVRVVYKRVFKETLPSSKLKKSQIQLQKFKIYFLSFWIVMGVLYVVFALKPIFSESKEPKDIPEVVAKIKEAYKFNQEEPDKPEERQKFEKELVNKFNEINHLAKESSDAKFLINITEILNPNNQKGIPEKINDLNQKAIEMEIIAEKSSEALHDLLFPFLGFAFSNINLVFIFGCFSIMFSPSYNRKSIRKRRIMIFCSVIAVVFLTSSFLLLISSIKSAEGFTQTNLTAYQTVFFALNGTLSALALALLIARLDSKFIGLPSWLISILYFYAAVQPLIVAFEQPGEVFQIIATSLFIIAFIFKIYFFFIITYAMQTGRLLNYLVCFPALNEKVDSIFANQFQFKIHKEKKEFSFSIDRKNVRIYSSDKHFKTRQKCQEAVEELCKLMTERSSYEIAVFRNKYFVKIMESDEDEICHSIKFDTKDEANELIYESIKKIPYCEV